jgi:cytochrome P450
MMDENKQDQGLAQAPENAVWDEQVFDPYDTQWMSDPYPLYAHLQAIGPVLWSSRAKAWLVTGHEQVRDALRDKSIWPNDLAEFVQALADRAHKPLPHLVRALRSILFFQHGSGHVEGRRLLVQVLNGRSLDELVPDMHAVAQDLLSHACTKGGFDVVHEFSDLMPHLVMGRWLGISPEDVRLMARSISGFMVIFNRGCPLREFERYNERMGVCLNVLERVIRERRPAQADDGIGRLIQLGDADGLDDGELAARCLFLFLTGSETSATFTAQAVRLLLAHPEELAKLRSGRVAMPQAVDELLRFESPVQQTVRFASEDRVLGGQHILAGDQMILMIAAANRDPLVFSAPNLLQLDRDAGAHLSFAAGTHHCIGERLARLEAAVALERFLELPPMKLSVDQAGCWSAHVMRRLKGLSIECV